MFLPFNTLVHCLILYTSLDFLVIQVNIGEQSLPIQWGQSSIVLVGYQLIVSDHDFHVVNLTPSVTLLTDIKPNENVEGGLPSFHKGELCELLFNIYFNSHLQLYYYSITF